MPARVALPAVFVAACLFVPSAIQAQAEITRPQPHLATEPLTVDTDQGPVKLAVEVAKTSEQQEVGLMFRKSVSDHGGMIFPMRPVRVAAFWMKNTIIPLDMVFIRADGTIARITTAKALTTSIDDSGEPVGAVLELGAGRAAALGIHEGDSVKWQGLHG